jgi:hypothetical protein
VQEVEHGVVGARAGVRAEHAVERERALEQVAVELLFEDVIHVDGRDAQQLAHVVAVEAPDVERGAAKLHGIGDAVHLEPRCAARVELLEQRGEAHETGMESLVRIGVGAAHASAARTVGVDRQVLALLRQGNGGEPARGHAQAPALEVEIACDARVEQVQQMRTRRHAKAWRKLARDRGAADCAAALEHLPRPAFAR